MSTTLSLVRQEMLRRGGDELGRVLGEPTSFTTTTGVFSSLATGGVLAERWIDKYLVRPDAASAVDRVRRITDYASATGTLTHAGTNYSDTTVTNEVCEILGFEPRYYDEAINVALGTSMQMDCTEVAASSSVRKHWLHAMPWITAPSDIKRITHAGSPQISRNRFFQKWPAYSGGALIPSDWTLSGASATAARNSTYTWRRGYATLAITPGAGAAAVLTGTDTDLMETGVSTDSLRSEVVTAVVVVRCTDTSNGRAWVDDGSGKQYSSYHTGGDTFEELSIEVTVSATASMLDFGFESAAAKAECQLGECYLIYGSISDAVRRDDYTEEIIYDKQYGQGTPSIPVNLPAHGKGSHFRVYSLRGYPQIATSRIDAGTADDDVIDAPKELIAAGAIARLYERLSQTDHSDAQRWRSIAAEWTERYEKMHRLHLYAFDTGTPGFKAVRPRYGYVAAGRTGRR